jgi:hypothetical protein
MRCVREILRLKYECGARDRAIARSIGIARSTVADYLSRLAAAGPSWPLPPTLTDTALEALLFVKAGRVPGTRRRPEPDWPVLHRERRRPGVTLMLLWQEYRAADPEGYGYSRFCELYEEWAGRLSPTNAAHQPAPGQQGARTDPASVGAALCRQPAQIRSSDPLLIAPSFGRLRTCSC